MKTCVLTITTATDGQENTITRKGEMQLGLSGICLQYREEHTKVSIQIQGERAQIDRQGDYSLHLDLERGKQQKGAIGIAGSIGEVNTYAYKIAYLQKEDCILLLLHYDLDFSGEIQKMKLRILARAEER